ncbi:peptidoglycan-binding protein [Cellvibrio sp. OA-2007]|uniref:peptidoglycan-binding protein n=1 Tax=Cellvibrio sp. OA-2007 TaxID=529823 RepID=UPI00078548E2|nr:peptidoglycan-binding protein [Cellvibrio sp. OA-2007]
MSQITLRKGSIGESVQQLQKLLNAYNKNTALIVDGDFGVATLNAVKRFQQSKGLTPDGVVGPKTWQALSLGTPIIPAASTAPSPQGLLADIAAKYIGTKETGNNKAGDSKALQAIFKSDSLVVNGVTDGYPWCAAFVSFCVQKLLNYSPFFPTIIPPREASVSRFLNIWAKNNNCLIFPASSTIFTPQKGDIVVFTFSHIGIVEGVNGRMITTIEGNTNDAGSREGSVVARKIRISSIIKSYIRLPVSISVSTSRMEEISRLC